MSGLDNKIFWKKLYATIQGGYCAVLMVVLKSTGSSPGRQGFKMFVDREGQLTGSIGGGIMEHKMVELCKSLIQTPFEPFVKHQIHKNNIPKNKSGMICSGEQHIAFYPLSTEDKNWIKQLLESKTGVIKFNEKGISFKANHTLPQRFNTSELTTKKWQLSEDIDNLPELLIVGGGHVSLALSKIASHLDFKIKTFDDRDNLNTVEENKYAEHIKVDAYGNIDQYISSGQHKYVVLMSFGYVTDKIVLKKLINHQFKYLGMMGSKEKVKQLFEELRLEGISQDQIDRIHSPIGLQISSQTVEEIAISILAEIIAIKNR